MLAKPTGPTHKISSNILRVCPIFREFARKSGCGSAHLDDNTNSEISNFQRGIRVEIHLVQDDISVRLAETKIDTSCVLDHLDEFREFSSAFENDNIRGTVTGIFILRSDGTVKK